MSPAQLLTITLLTVMTSFASATPLPVILENKEPHVDAAALERGAGIVIKKLPGRGEFVACAAEQCAPLNAVVIKGEALLVPVAALSEALHFTATYDKDGLHVELSPAAHSTPPAQGQPRVGSIVPNLKLTRLDGAAISLDELRGQRVLINSWASW